MSNIYTFYVEEANESLNSLTPQFLSVKHVLASGQSVEILNDGTFVTPTFNNLGDGFYSFSFDVEAYTHQVYLIKIDTGSVSSSHITLRLEGLDILDVKTKEIKTVADELKTIADRLDGHVQRLIDIEQGEWRIENNQLLFTHPTDPTDILATFNLYDNNGQPTSDNPFKRSVVQLKTI
tara:strand:+ start:614 stop:1150 length:537 start_codon:yes stop_codon:yes gene_type:complete